MAGASQLGLTVFRLAIRIFVRLVPVGLRITRLCLMIIFTYWASLRVGFPEAARIMADAWYKGLPLDIAMTTWGMRIYALYTVVAWVILLTGLVLQSLLVAWVVACLL